MCKGQRQPQLCARRVRKDLWTVLWRLATFTPHSCRRYGAGYNASAPSGYGAGHNVSAPSGYGAGYDVCRTATQRKGLVPVSCCGSDAPLLSGCHCHRNLCVSSCACARSLEGDVCTRQLQAVWQVCSRVDTEFGAFAAPRPMALTDVRERKT